MTDQLSLDICLFPITLCTWQCFAFTTEHNIFNNG